MIYWVLIFDFILDIFIFLFRISFISLGIIFDSDVKVNLCNALTEYAWVDLYEAKITI